MIDDSCKGEGATHNACSCVLYRMGMLEKENAELKAALSGRTVSCSNCNKLEAVAKAADCFLANMGEEEEGNLRHHLAALREKPCNCDIPGKPHDALCPQFEEKP